MTTNEDISINSSSHETTTIIGLVILLVSLVCLGTWPALLKLSSLRQRQRQQQQQQRQLQQSQQDQEKEEEEKNGNNHEHEFHSQRHLSHVYLDYALVYFITSSILPAVIVSSASSSSSSSSQSNNSTDKNNEFPVPLIAVAMIGGFLLGCGNLSFQWSTSFYHVPLTIVLSIQASLTILLGTYINYWLQPGKTTHPICLKVGVCVFLVAIAFATKAQLVYDDQNQGSSELHDDESQRRRRRRQQQHDNNSGATTALSISKRREYIEIGMPIQIYNNNNNHDYTQHEQNHDHNNDDANMSPKLTREGIAVICDNQYTATSLPTNQVPRKGTSNAADEEGGGTVATDEAESTMFSPDRNCASHNSRRWMPLETRMSSTFSSTTESSPVLLSGGLTTTTSSTKANTTRKGLLLAVLGGIAFGFFSPAFNVAMNDPFGWTSSSNNASSDDDNDGSTNNNGTESDVSQYDPLLRLAKANIWFSFAFWLCSVIGNCILLRYECNLEEEEEVSMIAILITYVRADRFCDRIMAYSAGFVCAMGNVLQFQGGQLVGYATADLVQAYPLVSTLWDIYLFHEFRHVHACSTVANLLIGMYLAYFTGICLLGTSSS